MAIEPKKNGTFASTFMFKGERIYAGGFTSEAEAKIWELQAREQLKAGLPVTYPDTKVEGHKKATKETIGKWLDKTYRQFWADKSEPQKARQKMTMINDFFGRTTDVNDLTMVWIDDWILSLKADNNSNATINRKLAALSKMLTYASDSGALTAKKPKINRLKEPKGRIRWLTDGEEKLILVTVNQWSLEDLEDVIPVLVDTGIRKGELLNMEKRDIQNGMLHIWVNKSDTPRSVPLTKRVKAILAKRVATLKETDKVFQISPDELARTWDRVRYHLELEDVTIHVFRHTTASRLVQRGIPLKTVQEWMGHKTIQTTLRYAHLSPKNLQDALAVLE